MSLKTSVAYFVECDNPCPLFHVAYTALTEFQNIKTVKISESDILTKNNSPNCKVNYVLSHFTGPAFDHLRQQKKAIFGPQVVLDYTRDSKPLPKWSVPLYSTALRGAVVCLTSIEGEERKKAYESVKMLHGTVNTGLTSDVNVLIAPKVGSPKYIVANELGIDVLLPSWLDEAWSVSACQDPVNMLSAAYIDRFRLPVFCQLVICSTGFTAEDSQKICGLVESQGGEFSREFLVGACSHLVVNKPSGKKFEYAKKWKVQTVTLQWILDSVEKGYALKEENYTVLEENDSSKLISTPKSGGSNSVSHCDISAITVPHIGESQVNLTVDESILPTTARGKGGKSSRSLGYLRGCKIVLIGSKDRGLVDRLKSIIVSNGGRVFSSIQEKVTEKLTHVVLVTQPDCESLIKSLNRDSDIEHYVTSDWLLTCQSNNCRVKEADYLIPFEQEEEEDSTQLPEVQQPEKKPEMHEEDIEMIQSYFRDMEDDDFTGFASEQQKNDTTKLGLFHSLSFHLHEELSEDERQTAGDVLQTNGGSLVGEAKSAQYQICPLIFHLPGNPKCHQPKCIRVTFIWLNECIRQERVICVENLFTNSRDVMDYQFTPLILFPASKNILANCFMSLSGFSTSQRGHVITICQKLGAVVQSYLTKKPAPDKGLFTSTHLISATPSGDKFEFAMKWKIPAVSVFWLLACARAGERLPEIDYPVRDSGRLNESTTAGINDSTIIDIQLTSTTMAESTSKPSTSSEHYPRQQASLPQVDRLRKPATIPSPIHSPNLPTATTSEPAPTDPTFATPKSRPNLRSTPSTSLQKTPSSLINCSVTSSVGTPWDQVTPSKYLTKGVPYIPKFDVPAILAGLKTPEKSEEPDNAETPMHVLLERGINVVCEITDEMRLKRTQTTDSSNQRILADCCICVAKFDSHIESEMYSLVNKLGGDFRWKYDEKYCTHLISSFKIGHDRANLISANSQNLDPMQLAKQVPDDIDKALQHKKFIVHPQWLRDCAAEFVHQPETSYNPVTFLTEEEKQRSMRDESCKKEEPPKPSILGTVLSLLKPDCSSSDNNANTSHPVTRRKNKRRRMGSGDDNMDCDNDIDLNNSTKKIRSNCENVKPQPSQALEIKWAYDDNSCDKYFCAASNNKSPPSPVANIVTHQQVTKMDNDQNLPNSTRYTRQSVLSRAHTATSSDTARLGRVDPSIDRPRVIMFTSLVDEEKNDYGDLISRLGGQVVEDRIVSDAVTHFITKYPARSERFMVCLARGLWILHKSYLDACTKANGWVSEEGYEWGGIGTEPMLSTLDGSTARISRELAKAAKRWRMRNGGAFQGWKVVIYAPDSVKLPSFRRLIEAGGGTVLAVTFPYPKPSEVTHAFAEAKPHQTTHNLPKDFDWILPDYMAAYLTNEPPPSPKTFSISSLVVTKQRK